MRVTMVVGTGRRAMQQSVTRTRHWSHGSQLGQGQQGGGYNHLDPYGQTGTQGFYLQGFAVGQTTRETPSPTQESTSALPATPTQGRVLCREASQSSFATFLQV